MNPDIINEIFSYTEEQYIPVADTSTSSEPPYNPLDDFPRSSNGSYIPIVPDRDEKKRIRRYYSKVGLMLIFSLILMRLLGALMIRNSIFGLSSAIVDTLNQDEVYDILFSDELLMTLINLGAILCSNLLIFFIGCRITRLKPSAFLSRARKTSFPLLLTFAFAGFFIQTVSTLAASYMFPFEDAYYSAYVSTPLSVVLAGIYQIIAAPIGEELLFRGFVLKNLSRANTHFGIMASALLFGLYHGNMSQLFAGFFMGILLGYLAVYTGSLRVPIFVHAAANTVSFLFRLVSDHLPQYIEPVYIIWCVFTIFFGLMALIYVKIIMPGTQLGYHHKTRGFAIAKTSVPFVAVCIVMLLMCIPQ